jgi:hypothetical protein
VVEIFLGGLGSDPTFILSLEPSLHLGLDQLVSLLKLAESDEDDRR